ncbi:hypothetical protein T484DRAFT_1854435 [Baffinella frigidus]|nr:hypothetical protein T484DRAFT_1854435 [Cryptophyta sp. CCMP2293]
MVARRIGCDESMAQAPGEANNESLLAPRSAPASTGDAPHGVASTRAATPVTAPVSEDCFWHTAEFLRNLAGLPNISQLNECTGGVIIIQGTVQALVLSYFKHEEVSAFIKDFLLTEVRGFIRALCDVHAKGLIHRDVKHANFLHNRTHGTFMLVDFTIAQQKASSNSGTPGCRGPEAYADAPCSKFARSKFCHVVAEHSNINDKLEVDWGVINSNLDVMRRQGHTWRTICAHFAKKTGCQTFSYLEEGVPFFCLLGRLLDIDPRTRITAAQAHALEHPGCAEVVSPPSDDSSSWCVKYKWPAVEMLSTLKDMLQDADKVHKGGIQG